MSAHEGDPRAPVPPPLVLTTTLARNADGPPTIGLRAERARLTPGLVLVGHEVRSTRLALPLRACVAELVMRAQNAGCFVAVRFVPVPAADAQRGLAFAMCAVSTIRALVSLHV